ncbi:MAG: VWA domain-containing protein [Chloroflexales bacterium]|nr:VWA domain-containing protein [Chloroflexales bacterium]
MDRSAQTRPTRYRVVIVLLLVLVFPLLAACGGAAASLDSDERSSTGSQAPRDAGVVVSTPSASERQSGSTSPPESEFVEAAIEPVSDASSASGFSAEVAPAGTTSAAAPELPKRQGRVAPLKAGEVDDNTEFQDYLTYLQTYEGPHMRTVDVSERYIITVLDADQRPLLDARVRIYDEQQQVFAGRTYAGGKTIFFPRALDVSPNVTEFRVVAERDNNIAETSFARGGQEQVEIAIGGVQQPDELKLDLLFLLDTTGSMSDELRRIQDTLDSIVQRIDTFQPRPNLRLGLVAYRDRGDEYVTLTYDFTANVVRFREVLNGLAADGGGDTPEAVNEALHEAIQGVQWSNDAVRLVFLVADAEPHLDYSNDYDYVVEIQEALAQGVKIYPIAASNTEQQAEYVFRQLAQQTLASFIFLTYQPGQNSGAPGDTTTLAAGDQEFTVDRLDDLIVYVVERELARAVGAV